MNNLQSHLIILKDKVRWTKRIDNIRSFHSPIVGKWKHNGGYTKTKTAFFYFYMFLSPPIELNSILSRVDYKFLSNKIKNPVIILSTSFKTKTFRMLCSQHKTRIRQSGSFRGKYTQTPVCKGNYITESCAKHVIINLRVWKSPRVIYNTYSPLADSQFKPSFLGNN